LRYSTTNRKVRSSEWCSGTAFLRNLLVAQVLEDFAHQVGDQQHFSAAKGRVVDPARERKDRDLLDFRRQFEPGEEAGDVLSARLEFLAETPLARLPAFGVQRRLDVHEVPTCRIKRHDIELALVAPLRRFPTATFRRTK
jgi:hypothetical protein